MTRGQPESRTSERTSHRSPAAPGGILDQFLTRALALTDEQREAVAERRGAMNESLHEAALRSAAEALVEHSDLYAEARRRLAVAHIPDALEREDLSTAEQRRWDEVSRLVQLSIDEMLVALVGSEVLHPNHLRELTAPWSAFPR